MSRNSHIQFMNRKRKIFWKKKRAGSPCCFCWLIKPMANNCSTFETKAIINRKRKGEGYLYDVIWQFRGKSRHSLNRGIKSPRPRFKTCSKLNLKCLRSKTDGTKPGQRPRQENGGNLWPFFHKFTLSSRKSQSFCANFKCEPQHKFRSCQLAYFVTLNIRFRQGL